VVAKCQRGRNVIIKRADPSCDDVPRQTTTLERPSHRSLLQFPTIQHRSYPGKPVTTMSTSYLTSLIQLGLTSALSAYSLYLSYQNITRLQQYEEKSKKAADWSNTAAQRLHKTRSTQTSGTATVSSNAPLTLHEIAGLTSHQAHIILPHIHRLGPRSRAAHTYIPCRRRVLECGRYVPLPNTHGEFLERHAANAHPLCREVQRSDPRQREGSFAPRHDIYKLGDRSRCMDRHRERRKRTSRTRGMGTSRGRTCSEYHGEYGVGW
jgi:hypothetical protein